MNEFVDASVDKIINKVTNVLFLLYDYKRFTHSELSELVKEQLTNFKIFPHDDRYNASLSGIIDAYETEVGIKIFAPDIMDKDPDKIYWFEEAKKIKTQNHESNRFFDRYKAYLLNEGFNSITINSDITLTAEKTLSRCADPKSVTKDHVKGLVVGDVQSGKTANYLALANLAYDYGYRIVLILAGLTDSLRMQTQQRTDEGVIGAISDSIGNNVEFCGVGKSNNEYYVIPYTNNSYDFAKFISQNLNAGVNDFNKPVILVVKKNRKILESVIDKLQSATKDFRSNSLLIIDDEADNASVSTKRTDEAPSAINKCIRDIFNKFPIASYVGYTATPFANIFINYRDEEDNLDLFPSDFIIQLNAPSTYFGAHTVFPSDGKKSKYLRMLDVNEPNFLPVKHKKDDVFCSIPGSLKEAILSFLINNVIRTIRGHKNKHRTMMINISRFNAMQNNIKYVVDGYVEKIKRIIEQDSYLPTEEFIKDSEMKLLFDTFMDCFYDNVRNGDVENNIEPINWEQIKNGLYFESQLLSTIIVNSRCKNEDRLNYDNYNNGARLIAIGGFVLSRGLTLEGLMVSYYSRNAGAYDVLLQMCRWFGYRPKYMDLCRIYLSDSSLQCFNAVIDAVDDLKKQFRDMIVADKKPKDFGLKVKESPDTLETKSLLVTSRNKMYNGEDIYLQLDYGGVYADTSKIPVDKEINEHNIRNVILFYNFLKNDGYLTNDDNKIIAQGIPKEKVAEFLSNLKISYKNRKFDVNSLSDYVKTSDLFEQWDVVIANGSSRSRCLSRFNFNETFFAPVRSCVIEDDLIKVGKGNNRLLDPSVLGYTINVSQEMKERILQKKSSEDKEHRVFTTLDAKDYLDIRDNPMIIIYPLDLKGEGTNEEDRKKLDEKFGVNVPIIAFAIAFPHKTDGVKVKYKINKVMADKLINDLKSSDDEDEEEIYSYD